VQRYHRSVTVRLAIALAGVMGLFVMLEQSSQWQHLFEPLNVCLAQATERVLQYMEMPVTRRGAVLMHPDGFSYRITYVCSGFRPAALIAVTLLVVPASGWIRLCGLLVAVIGIEALNLCRLVHLYWTGVVDAESFFVAHRVIWNIVAIIAGIGFLAVWIHLTGRNTRHAQQRSRALHAI
jgi:exosortase/archaeosortase family protein